MRTGAIVGVEALIRWHLRIFEPALLDGVTIRRFDGADTWRFLD